MTDKTKKARIIEAMNEVERQMERAVKRYTNSTKCLKYEILKNGNDMSAECPWLDFCLYDKERINKLKAHMEKLQAMLAAVA
jgi:hypothetical protein